MIRPPAPMDTFLIMLVALFWASAFVAIELTISSFPPVWVAALRVLIGCLALLPFALTFTWNGAIDNKTAFLLGLIALLNFALPFSLIAWAQTSIDAGAAALLMGTGPVFSLAVSHITTKDDRWSPAKVGAVAVCGGAVLLVLADEAATLSDADLAAVAAVLGASLSYVLAGALSRKVNGIPTVAMTAIVLAGSAAMLLPAAALSFGLPAVYAPASAWIAVVYLGAVPTGVAFVLRYHLIRRIGLSRFSLGMSLVPVFGIALAALILGEHVDEITVVAGALILLSMKLAR